MTGKNIFVFGKRGSGKTTFIKFLISKSKKKCLILDCIYYNSYDDISQVKFTSYNQFLKKYNNEDKIFFHLSNNIDILNLLNFFTQLRNVNIFIDEFSFFNYEEKKILNNIIRYGRQKNVNLILASRRIQEFSLEFLSQYNTIIVFHTDAIRDLEYLERIIDENINIEEIRKLETFQFKLYGEKDFLLYL